MERATMTEQEMRKENNLMDQQAFPDFPLPEKRTLLVIVQKLEMWQKLHCMHLVSQDTGMTFASCNTYAEAFCSACGRPLCSDHVSERVYLSNQGNEDTSPCLSCEKLTEYDLKAIRALRLGLNS
jgi:hypothetical protein